MNNFLDIEKQGGLAIIWLDQPDSPQNTISPKNLPLLKGVFEGLFDDDDIKAIVLASKKKDFIAGADIHSFLEYKSDDNFFKELITEAQSFLRKIEDGTKPIVAAIHGTCFGGGLEIALACTARIASDSKRTKFALPEVKLGLLPGLGGTQRLPRRVGLQSALDMMLTGKNIYAKPALKMGLVDYIVNEHALLKAAKKLAFQLAEKPLERKDKRSFFNRALEKNYFTSNIIFREARKKVKSLTQGNYPAPFEILKCVETGWSKGLDAGFQSEAERFQRLIQSPESEQLINIFFAMTAKKKNPLKKVSKPVTKVGMLGAGFMGAGITEVTINKGVPVVLKDLHLENIASAKKTIYGNYKKKLKRKIVSVPELEQTMGLIEPSVDYASFGKVDIVVEAVFEDLALKQKVLEQCEAVTADHCIFASNTSALPIAQIAEKAKRPDQVIGLHYFSPVPKMPLLEIVKTKKTADWVIATCLDLGILQGKTCIVVNDSPGFYTTRILAPMLNEALLLLEAGGDILEIDKALKKFGFPVGPVTLMDEVGIDVGAHIMSGDLMAEYMKRPGAQASKRLLEMAEKGYKGRKNGKGFYAYNKQGKKTRNVDDDVYEFFGGEDRKSFRPENMAQQCGYAMINEAVICLQDGVIENPLDGDIGAIFGLGFPPFRGGPFRYIDAIGADKALEHLERLQSKLGDRFQAAQMIVDAAKSGKKFYS